MYIFFVIISAFFVVGTLFVLYYEIGQRIKRDRLKKETGPSSEKAKDQERKNEYRHICPNCQLSYTTYLAKSQSSYLFQCNDCKTKYLTD